MIEQGIEPLICRRSFLHVIFLLPALRRCATITLVNHDLVLRERVELPLNAYQAPTLTIVLTEYKNWAILTRASRSAHFLFTIIYPLSKGSAIGGM